MAFDDVADGGDVRLSARLTAVRGAYECHEWLDLPVDWSRDSAAQFVERSGGKQGA